MRIRTIKPEFWSHPVMGKLSDSTRLLAIGLLNLADDEGYFYADPLLIRSTLFPFQEHSGNVPVMLLELSETGYIGIKEHPTHGKIGCVLSFKDHQTISHPYPSKIKDLYHSGNVPVMLLECSSNVPGGKERKGKEQGTGNGKEQGMERPPNPPGGDEGEKGHAKNLPTSIPAIRIAHLFKRRLTTPWSEKEVRAFKKLHPLDLDELTLVEGYYEAERAKGNDGFHRRDMLTFLNNFQGEVDRARQAQISRPSVRLGNQTTAAQRKAARAVGEYALQPEDMPQVEDLSKFIEPEDV